MHLEFFVYYTDVAPKYCQGDSVIIELYAEANF